MVTEVLRARVRNRAERQLRPLVAGEVLVVLVLVAVYDRIRDVAATRAGQAMGDARQVLSVESWLHLDVERSLNTWLSHVDTAEWLAAWYYQLMHLTVTLGVLVWIYARHPSVYRPARNALITINAIGLLVFWLLPVAPPRLLPGFVDSGVVTGATENVAHVSPDLYAAMPSLHVGWVTWVVLQVFLATTSRTLRGMAVTHGVLTSLIVVATANHFVLDVVAGVAVAFLAAWWCRPAAVAAEHRPLVSTG